MLVQETSTSRRFAAAHLTALLVAVAERRDKEAFSMLFAHYAPRIKSFLMRKGASESSAEELSQEAMLSVWRKADRFDPQTASAGTWIFTVARNLRIDTLRKEKRLSFYPDDPLFVPEPEMPPDTAISMVETRVRIKAAITGLPEARAEVVRLSFYEDKSHREIAQELDLPLGTVKSRLRLAMRKLRSALGAELRMPVTIPAMIFCCHMRPVPWMNRHPF